MARDATSIFVERILIPLLAVWRGVSVIGALVFWIVALAAAPAAISNGDYTDLMFPLLLAAVGTLMAVIIWWLAGRWIEAAEKAGRARSR